MTLTKLTRWSLCATVMAVGVGVVVGAAETRTARADTAQGVTCSWKASGSAAAAVYHGAGAVDKNGKAYIFGGLNQDGKAQQNAQAMDMSATNPATLAGSRSESLRNVTQKVWGAAAAYRPSNDPAKAGMIYVIGGSNDDVDYTELLGASPPSSMIIDGEDRILEYDIDANSWRAITGIGSIGNRLFPAASYSPERNAILITGGVRRCDFVIVVTDKKNCTADTGNGVWLKFDDTGAPTGVETESGGPNKVYGHTSVYDPDMKQIIIAGGTSTGNTADRSTDALDLSGATPTWKSLPNMPKGLAFHSAAYSPALKHVIVHGGSASSFFRTDESFSTTTYGLDLSGAAPAWVDLRAGNANPSARIGAVMGYVTNAAGLMSVVMTSGRNRLTSASQSPSRNNEALVCDTVVDPTVTPPTVTPVTPDPGTVTVTATTPPATATPLPPGQQCPGLEAKAPGAAIAAALANAGSIGGHGMRCNPNVPESPVNPVRNRLSLRNVNQQYHPVYNGFVWKCGCP